MKVLVGGAAKMRTADTMVCEVCGKNPLVRELSHFLRSLIFCGRSKEERVPM